jgi:hypothetical protein
VTDPQRVYVVLWEDRHNDVGAYLFTDVDVAVSWAQRTAREHDRHGVLDETLTDDMRECGWLYYGCYSVEGDCLRVVPCGVDAEG